MRDGGYKLAMCFALTMGSQSQISTFQFSIISTSFISQIIQPTYIHEP